MDLGAALGLSASELVSFVGAGGKKTAMASLATEADERGLAVGYTTTTHTPPPDGMLLVLASSDDLPERLTDRTESPVAFARWRVPDPERVDEKVRGFDSGTVDAVFESGRFDWLLVKADGARTREFKAPGDDEPRIPPASTVVVPVASVRVVGTPLTGERVHRVERVAALTGLDPGDRLTATAVGTVLAHPEGGLKDVPPDARVVPLVNKADTRAQRAVAREVLAAALDRSDRIRRGLVTSFREGTLRAVGPDTAPVGPSDDEQRSGD